MPSPFPGMDPYLEGQYWPGVHNDLCTEIKRQLAPKLAPRYYPFTVRYIIFEISGNEAIATDQIIPDAGVTKQSSDPLGGSTSAIAAPPLQVRTIMRLPVPHYRIEIRDLDQRELVTAIELLSPTNKQNPGRKQYLRKRDRILESSAHLVEIDLLRKGKRVPMEEPLPPAPYYVFVSRSEKRPITDAWPSVLDQPLPTIPIPLLPGDLDVPLDLQQAFKNVYDLGRYDLAVNYQSPPDVPLSPEERTWVGEQLRKAGTK